MKKLLFLLLLSLFSTSGAGAKVAGPVGIFDLRYTLNYDYTDPARLMLVWDDCHTVATLQGVVNRDFIIFYVGCYDNPAWTSRNTLTLWDDPNRGKLPLMWCVTPIIEQRAPHVLHHWRKSASPNDYFAAGDNGAGYTSVGQLQKPRLSGVPDGCRAWAEHCKPYYEKWGLSVTGFIINTFAPPMGDRLLDAFQSFSYNGIVPNGDGLTQARLYKGMPVLKSVTSLTNPNPQSNKKMTLDECAQTIARSVKNRQPFHFHWYRAINMSPTWYVELMERVHKLNPNIVLLDTPAYFELLRIWLEQNPDAFPLPERQQ